MTQPLSSHGTLLKMGDGIGTLGTPTLVGAGLDDLTLDAAALYRGARTDTYRVYIDSVGANDTFKWSRDDGVTWEAEGVPIAGAATAMELEFYILIEFAAITGHTLDDYWTITAAPAFTAIAELVDSAGPSFEQAIHEAPSQATTWVKKVAGMMKAKEATFDINLIPKDATHDKTTGLLSLLGLQYTTAWQLLYNDAGAGTASHWVFDAYLAGYDPDQPVDGILKASVTLGIDGEPVFTEGT